MHCPLQIIRVALFVVAMHAAFEAHAAALDRMSTQQDTRLPLSCKNIARDVIMNSCKGPRGRRSLSKVDLEDLEKQSELGASELPTEEGVLVSQQKRQWGMGSYSGMGGYPSMGGYPGMEIGMQNNYHNRDIETPFFDIQDNRGSEMMQEQFGGGYMPMPYGAGGMFPMKRSADISDRLLGYELSPEELEELHEEIGERMPRNSKNMNKKIFMSVAAKCCPNPKLCYENPSLIPCMGY